jgi:glycosyltransferase involved in cell wall biosynthesis
MAQGTPVVAIAELGTASILIEGKGALISTENESEFVQKVHSILINPQRRQQLSEAAFDYAQKKWSAEIQAERMLKYYMLVVSMHQSQSKKPEVLSIQQN